MQTYIYIASFNLSALLFAFRLVLAMKRDASLQILFTSMQNVACWTKSTCALD